LIKHILSLLLAFLTLTAQGLAETQPKASLPEAEEVAKLVVRLYQKVGPRLGCKFVEADLVITLAGLRAANGRWSSVTPASPADQQKLALLAPILQPRGLRLKSSWSAEDQHLSFGVESLEGLERVSRESKLPGVVPFLSTQGWPGFELYRQTLLQNFQGNPNTKDCPQDIVHGFYLGYPDRALLDFASFVRGQPTQAARVRFADYYQCPVPRWDMAIQSTEDPQILEIEERWSQFLEKFYSSPSHQWLAKEQDFIDARRANLLGRRAWLKKYRDIHQFHPSPESVRLGAGHQ